MYNLLKMERYCLKHNKLFWGCLFLITVVGILFSSSYVENLTARMDAIGIFDAMVYDSTFCLILCSAIITMFLGQEFSNRTITILISSGHSRATIFISKFFTYSVIFNIFMLMFPVAGSLRMSFVLGWDGLLIDNALHILQVLGFSILLNSAVCSICVFFTFFFRDMAKSISVSTMVVLLCGLLLAYGVPMGWFSSFPWLRFFPMYQIREILSYSLTTIQFIEALISGIMYLLFFIIFSFGNFRVCELK